MLATPELIEESAQSEKLAEILPRCRNTVPLYAGAASRSSAEGFQSSLECLKDFPLITKQHIRRDFPRNFLGPTADLEALAEDESIELEHTAGTSEERTPLLLPKGWWIEQEREALELNGTVAQLLAQEPQARRVTISSPVCNSEVCYTGVPSCETRTVDNTLFLSLSRFPFLWSRADLARMAEEALAWEPRFLDVDPVYGVVFARYCEGQGVRLPSLRFILCSYEFVSRAHRRILERAFGVPVFDLYGSTETGHLLMEDETGQMRPSLQTALLEVIDVKESGIGELVVTTLTNRLMPLIRYRIGDLVEKRELACGTRYVVHGRAAEAFRRPSGRRVTVRQVDECLAEIPGIAHYQLHERRNQPWRLRYVPDAEGPGPEKLAELECRLRQQLELDQSLKLEPAELLLAEQSGKFRLCYPEGSTS